MAGACFTIEKFPKGYGWRLRDLDHGVIGASTEVFGSRDEAMRDVESSSAGSPCPPRSRIAPASDHLRRSSISRASN